MDVKQYLLSAEDIQELINIATNKGELKVTENPQDYLEISGHGIVRTFDLGNVIKVE